MNPPGTASYSSASSKCIDAREQKKNALYFVKIFDDQMRQISRHFRHPLDVLCAGVVADIIVRNRVSSAFLKK